jgi:hypothetical protein
MAEYVDYNLALNIGYLNSLKFFHVISKVTPLKLNLLACNVNVLILNS